MVSDKKLIDLACGANKLEGYFGIDIADGPNVDLVHDLNKYPWPIEDNSVEKINCSHFVEHIRHDDVFGDIKNILEKVTSFDEFKNEFDKLGRQKDGFIKFMEEVYRILKPGGIINITAPYVMHTRAFGDPTHTRYIHDMSFAYFNKQWRDANKLSHYDINCDFDITYSYAIDNDMVLKSDEYKQKAFKEKWNSISDIIVKLTKI